jgi:hypothetical protein
MSNKSVLKSFFVTGARPNQLQFADLIDSGVNLLEANSGNVQVSGGVVVGNTTVPDVPGAIKWDGTNFQFRDAVNFKPLNLAGATISNPQDIGNVRIGSTLAGNPAVLAHNTKYTDNDFAFGQTSGGTTIVSSGGINPIVFQNRSGGIPTTVLTIQGNKAKATDLTVTNQLVVGVAVALPPMLVTPTPTLLAVFGDAQKLTGGVWTVMSDVRVKKDIAPFTEGLRQLLDIKPVWFKYKGFDELEAAQEKQVGVLAHEIRSTFPYMIKEAKENMITEDGEVQGLLSFNGSALPYVIVNAIKELNKRLDRIEQSQQKEKNTDGNRTT